MRAKRRLLESQGPICQIVVGLTLVAWASGCQKSGSPRLGVKDAGLDARAELVDVRQLDQAQDAPAASDSVAEAHGSPEVGNDRGPACAEGAQQACASPANPLVGACHAGARICAGGAWGPCSEALPAAAESCNGIDDNCNGMTDEGCAAGCFVVCANCPGSAADGAVADGSLDRPFVTLAQAIAALADSPIDGGTRRRLCVAGGTSCDDAWAYRSAGPLTIADSLIVQGGYAVTPTGLTYCDASPRPRTTLEFTSHQGVRFDARVLTGAELSGFVVEVTRVTTSEPDDATVAVAINGAQNVSLSRVFISEALGGPNTYGVRITAGGQATIIGSAINAGHGRTSAFAVHVDGGTVNLRNNCDELVAGGCTSECTDCGPQLGIRGGVTASVLDAPAVASAVYIAGGSGSSVVGNMICGGTSGMAAGASAPTVATVLCEGSGCTTVSGNLIVGGTDRDAVGLALVGASPSVDGNRIEGGCGSSTTTGVWLEGSSARLQNNRILGGRCPGTGSRRFFGLQVKAGEPTDNPDVHSNDIEPLGLASDCQSVGVLLERSSGPSTSSTGLLRNNIISTGVCSERTAVYEATGVVMQGLLNNDLYAPAQESFGGTSVLYHHSDGDATIVAQVNARPGADGNISVDPQYAAYLSDFRLTAGSPCIDRGIADGAPGTDADAHLRPAGLGYDIGAYEFHE